MSQATDQCAMCGHDLLVAERAWERMASDIGIVVAANYCGDRHAALECMATVDGAPCARVCGRRAARTEARIHEVAQKLRARLVAEEGL